MSNPFLIVDRWYITRQYNTGNWVALRAAENLPCWPYRWEIQEPPYGWASTEAEAWERWEAWQEKLAAQAEAQAIQIRTQVNERLSAARRSRGL